MIGGLLLIAPLRIIQHVDVYWRLPLWAHAFLVVGTTHVVLAQLFGWKASRAILPAMLFALLAVPLPHKVETELIHLLTSQVVNLVGGVLPLLGYPVDVSGNSLIVKGELFDVAEGCSGIRSFQSSLMAGVCLGELLLLSWRRRILLVLGAFLLAIVCNGGRIFWLARIAYERGRDASDAAHDSVGVWALLGTYGGISLVAWGLLVVFPKSNRVKRTIQASAHD